MPPHIVKEEAGRVILTTSISLPSIKDYEVIDIVTAECAFGMNFFRDLFAQMNDIFGGRSGATQKALRDARNVCLFELRREALIIGADAVIGVSLNYTEFSGGGKHGLLMLVASGTAIRGSC